MHILLISANYTTQVARVQLLTYCVPEVGNDEKYERMMTAMIRSSGDPLQH